MWKKVYLAKLGMVRPSGLATLLLISLVCLLPIILAPRLDVSLPSQAIQPESANAFTAPLPTTAYGLFDVVSDDMTDGQRSKLTFYEDGSPLGPGHSLHDRIRSNGRGAYSHWGGYLYFSTSDNSDPRTNGRSYLVTVPATLPTWLLIMLIAVSSSCVLFARNRMKLLNADIPGSRRPQRIVSADVRVMLALGLPLTIFALALAMPAQYKTNDDPFMRLIAEGVTATETQFLIYQNILAGLSLRSLYRWIPTVSWYDVELAAAGLIGATLSLAAVLRVCGTLRSAIFCCLISSVFLIAIFPFFQFTASAMLLASGGLLLISSYWLRPSKRKNSLQLASLAGAIAFTAAYLIRFEGALLAMLISMPMIVFLGFRTNKPLLWPAVGIACLLSVAFGLRAYDRAYYAHHPGWETFRPDADIRGRVTEYAHLDRSQRERFQSALTAAGWSATDYELLTNWLFGRRDLFSAARMQEFLTLMPTKSIWARITDVHQQLQASQKSNLVFVLIGLTPLFLRRSLRSALTVGLSFGWLYAVLLAVGVVFKPNMSHIVIPVYAVWVLTILLLVLEEPEKPPVSRFGFLEDKVLAGIVFILLSLAAVQQLQATLGSSKAAETLRDNVRKDTAIWPVPAGGTIIVWDHNFPYEVWVRPFVSIPPTNYQLFHTGPNSVTSHAKGFYKTWGSDDLAWIICSGQDVYLVDSRLGYAEPHAKFLKAYMQEHYNENVEIKSVFEGEALSLYSCRGRSR